MNAFDWNILSFFSHFARHSYTFDTAVYLLTRTDTPKGAVVMSLLYWAWNKHDDDRSRELLVLTVIGCFIAALSNKLVSAVTFYRPRPIQEHLSLVFPYGPDLSVLKNSNAFPSDHASLFAALSMGITLVDSEVGLVCWIYSLVFICLPRIYMGFHHPTDILAGIANGGLVMWLLLREGVRRRLSKPLGRLRAAYPGPFFAVFFFLTFEIATLFEGSREIASFWAGVAKNLLHHAA